MAKRVERLAEIAVSQPQAAYTVLTHGLASGWTFISWTMEETGVYLQQVEEMVRNKVIPALTERAQPGEVERELFALPARHGSLGLTNLCAAAPAEFMTSQKISEPIRKLIINQKPTLENSCVETYALKRAASATRMRRQKESAKALSPQLPQDLR